MSEVLGKPIADSSIHRELKDYFGGQIPGIFTLLEAQGMLDSLWPLFRDSFFDSGIESQAVKQGIALSVAVQAPEKACFLLHAYLLRKFEPWLSVCPFLHEFRNPKSGIR